LREQRATTIISIRRRRLAKGRLCRADGRSFTQGRTALCSYSYLTHNCIFSRNDLSGLLL